MTDREKEALLKIVAVADQQLDLLQDAARRTDVDVAGLSRVGLELLLQAIGAEVSGVSGEAFEAFAARAHKVKADTIDVRQHLIALGEGWRCRHCKADVVGAAVISGQAKGKLKVSLQCRSCGRTSPIDRLGMAAFKNKFGHLVGAGWDPTTNGFICQDGPNA